MKAVNLSCAQLKLLSHIYEQPTYVVGYYPPAKKLVELKLAEFRKEKLCITEAGRKRVNVGGLG